MAGRRSGGRAFCLTHPKFESAFRSCFDVRVRKYIYDVGKTKTLPSACHPTVARRIFVLLMTVCGRLRHFDAPGLSKAAFVCRAIGAMSGLDLRWWLCGRENYFADFVEANARRQCWCSTGVSNPHPGTWALLSLFNISDLLFAIYLIPFVK